MLPANVCRGDLQILYCVLRPENFVNIPNGGYLALDGDFVSDSSRAHAIHTFGDVPTC